MKKDNLKDFRDTRVKKNIQIIERTIDHIKKFKGVISMSNVAKVTREIVNIELGEKPITLSAISKNKIYRKLIENAKLNYENPSYSSIKKNAFLSEGDARLALHGLRVENELLKDELEILKSKLKNKKISYESLSEEKIINENELIAASAIKNLIYTLIEEELALVDIDTNNLVLHTYGTILLKGDLVKRFMGRKADD